MTISANDRRKTYVGNGVATAFNGPRAFLSSHIQVFTGTHPVYNLVPPSQYMVTGLRANTSKITFNAAPALNLDILILRTVPMDQPADITNQGAFLPEIHEDAFDCDSDAVHDRPSHIRRSAARRFTKPCTRLPPA